MGKIRDSTKSTLLQGMFRSVAKRLIGVSASFLNAAARMPPEAEKDIPFLALAPMVGPAKISLTRLIPSEFFR